MDDDINIFARTLYGEAEADDVDDAEAIAAVVMNRVRWKNWPKTAGEVCLQPFQFSCWNPGDPNRARILAADVKSPWFTTCRAIAVRALSGQLEDKTNGATHYYASYIPTPRWARGKTPSYVNTYGRYQHLFFNDIDTPPPTSAREALDQGRPLSESRTIKGAQVAGASTIAVALSEAATGIQPLVPYLDSLKWVFIALMLVGIGITVYARLSDRERGLR